LIAPEINNNFFIGTGKTSTLVECVAQILKLRPNSRVLISTQSNSACDEIGERLINYVSLKKVYRFYSPSLLNSSSGGPNPKLKPSSNLRNRKVEWPTKEEMRHFSVVISTLISSSRLAQSDIGEGHFDYIFVDEISCATEPEALVPIIGLGAASRTLTSNIILLGDHKQLGPVLASEEFSKPLGLGVSLMERMMSCSTYLKSPAYDDRYVVQLLDNYRSHPAILKFSSDQFYEGTLRAKMSLTDQQKTEAWNFLPNRKFPIIFHAVKTPSQLDGTSSYNDGEIEVAIKYVKTLLTTKFGEEILTQSDIGIISPYLAQLKYLKENLGVYWPKIEMGTAEYFQGREKRVILISTVKSCGGIGFLSNEKVRKIVEILNVVSRILN
jgi:helicase MOV-10